MTILTPFWRKLWQTMVAAKFKGQPVFCPHCFSEGFLVPCKGSYNCSECSKALALDEHTAKQLVDEWRDTNERELCD
jgi:hypothetical protein